MRQNLKQRWLSIKLNYSTSAVSAQNLRFWGLCP